MRLSSLRTPPRSGTITPILASDRSAALDTGTPGTLLTNPDVFCTPAKKQTGKSSRTSPRSRSPQMMSPRDKKLQADGHKCMCEICTCGMHICKCKPSFAFEGNTTNRDMHREYPLPVMQRSQPKLLQSHKVAPFEGESSYKREFVEKDLPRYEYSQPIVEPPVPLNAESSYTRDYTAKESEKLMPLERSPRPQQPFYGNTSYREFFFEKPLPEKSRPRPKSAEGMRRRPWEEPLGGKSTYTTEYDKKDLPPREALATFDYSSVPFEGESSYRRSYTTKELPKQQAPVHTEKPSQAFYGETTYRQQYSEREMPKSLSRKKSAPPATMRRTWQEPLEGRSTYKTEYTEKPLPREARPEMKQEKAVPFQGESSYKRDYVEKKSHFEAPSSPAEKPAQPFYGESSYRKFYDGKPATPTLQRKKSAAPSSPRPWADPLGGKSTYDQEFTVKQVPREQPTKYVVEPTPRFEGESSYKREYTEKKISLEKRREPSPKPQQQFFGETSYRNYYTEKHVPLPRNGSKPDNGKRPTPWNDPLNAVSSYSCDFQPHAVSAERPTQYQPSSSPDSRDFATTYEKAFVPKALHTCPVTRMPQAPHFAPEGREHNFWDQDNARWC